jgi:hypothetical protein
MIRRFLEWLYRMTFEVGENHFDTFGTYADTEDGR